MNEDLGIHEFERPLTRRSLLKASAVGFASLGAAGRLASRAAAAPRGSRAASQNLALALNGSTDIKNFNQAVAFDGGAWFLSSCIYSRLTVMDYGPEFAIHPQLATSWEVNPDATLYTFHMVRNATFHDGTPVTSADVKVSYEGILKNAGPAAAVMQNIERIDTPDPYTVKIVLSKPNAALLYSLSVYPWTPILPAHLYKGTDWKTNPYNLKPVGSGPFKFQELVHGDHVTLVRNDNYFGKKPILQQVAGQFVPDNQTALQGLESGQYGALNDPPALGLIHQLRQNSSLQVEAPPGPWLCYMGMNMTKGPLKDHRVREALLLAINRPVLTKKVTGGVAPPASNPYVSGIRWAWDPHVKYPAYNPREANQLLDAAGYPRKGGTRFTLNLLCDTVDDFYRDTADVLKNQLGQVGIHVNIQLVDDATFLAQAPKLEHDLIVYALWIGPDPDQWNELLKTANAKTGTGFRNWFGYNNPTVNDWFDKAVEFSARNKRRTYYYKIQQTVAHDLPYVGLFEAPYSFAHRKSYQGFFSEKGFISYRMDLTHVHQV